MLSIARSSAKSTGQSMEFMLQSIVTGLGRGSKLILDNLGIMIDTNKAYEIHAQKLGKVAGALTEAEKKQAFINEAMRIGMENTKKAGAGALNASERFDRLMASISNMANQLGSKAIPIFNAFIDAADKVVNGFSGLMKPKTELQEINIRLKKSTELLKEKQAILKSDNWFTKLARNEEGIRNEIAAIEESISKIKERRDAVIQAEQAEADAKARKGEATKAALDAENAAKEEQDTINKENQLIKEQEYQEGLTNLQIQADLARNSAAYAAETDKQKKLELLKKKEELKDKARQKGKEIRDKKAREIEMQQAAIVANHSATLANNLVQLTDGKNKELLYLQKGLAIAQILINGEIAKMRALAELGPVAGSIAAGVITANQAVSIALVAKQKLAEGGIVKASHGGTAAIIGEGGKDEAVIPLDDDEAKERLGGGGSIVINVYGGLLGDETSANEFITAIDRELLQLRRSGESLAFDEGII
jgi:hypothetical protein